MQLNARPTSIFRLALLLARLLGVAVALLALTAAASSRRTPIPVGRSASSCPTQAGAAQDILARLLQPDLEKSLGQPIIVGTAGREHHDRNRRRRQGDAGRLYAPDRADDVHGQCGAQHRSSPSTSSAISSRSPSWSRTRCCSRSTPRCRRARWRNSSALAKAEPGKLNYGTSGASTQAHLLLEMWSARAGIKMQHIPYRGGAPAALAVAAGEVQLVLLSPLGILPQVDAGWWVRLRPAPHPRSRNFRICRRPLRSGFPASRPCSGSVCWRPEGRPRRSSHKLNDAVNRALRAPDLRRSSRRRARRRPAARRGVQGADRERDPQLEGAAQRAGIKAE